MIHTDKEFAEGLANLVSEISVNEIEKQIKIYLTERIRTGRIDFSDLGKGFISTYDEFCLYLSEFAYKMCPGECCKMFQDLMTPAKFMDEKDRI